MFSTNKKQINRLCRYFITIYQFRRSINMSQINEALDIPSLNPDKKIMQVIRQTVDQGFSTILVVDDGSNTAHKQIFQTLCPVSYTHLDVYKRQPVPCVIRKMWLPQRFTAPV